MKIGDILKPECVLADISGDTKKDILTALSKPIAKAYGVSLDELVDTLLDRENLGSTGIGEGIAIPHGKIRGLKSIAACVARSSAGLAFNALDGEPCHIFFVLAAPSDSAAGHLKALARASVLLKNPTIKESLIAAGSAADIYKLLIEYDSRFDD
ncbi:MAG TPA: PTS sugar transporter subunit IIA [Deltaproteobacteria bacterium]|jgi:PTS system nitrogen regulatory IIA component|nr:PTS sugar transporter subunit IIA [Deltaproteobacteria bacterium]HQI01066.1 PTS sugar transporter subunit IIA [Deltaproteobacteria bacterium]